MTFYLRIYQLITLLFCISLSTSCYGTPPEHRTSHNDHLISDFPSMAIAAPEIPSSIIFANETINLTRYDLRERIDRELINFSYMHASTLLLIKRANRYFPVIEPILKQQGIPDDFKYLMVIESNLIPTSRSGSGAAGLWQFMPATAQEFGLIVNTNVDERFHTIKATEAACQYLKAAYARYGNWMSVAASYNAGQGFISRALNKQQAETALDLWMNEETSRYMFRILAIKMIFEDPQAFGFFLTEEQLYPPMEYTEIEVTSTIPDLISFASKYNISYAQLKEANLWLRDSTLENKTGYVYTIYITDQNSIYYNPKKTKAHSKNWIIKEH